MLTKERKNDIAGPYMPKVITVKTPEAPAHSWACGTDANSHLYYKSNILVQHFQVYSKTYSVICEVADCNRKGDLYDCVVEYELEPKNRDNAKSQTDPHTKQTNP